MRAALLAAAACLAVLALAACGGSSQAPTGSIAAAAMDVTVPIVAGLTAGAVKG